LTPRPSVLVADDDPDLLALVTFCLAKEYEVITATDGDDALRQIVEQTPDLAVLDIKMPKLDGFEVLRRLRAADATRELPVTLLSADGREEKITLAEQAGADYMRKPFNQTDLLARVRQKLSQS
jgi:DNA-binding response OmpR family regulator